MKSIKKDEIFNNLTSFLAEKGVELKAGSYSQTLQKGCGFLTEVINRGQKGFDQARQGLDQGLEKLRQKVHEKTAPKAPPSPAAGPKARPARPRTAPRPKAPGASAEGLAKAGQPAARARSGKRAKSK